MRLASSIVRVFGIALVVAASGVAQQRNPTPLTIPVLQIPAGATSRDDAPVRQAIEPLSMSARIEITQKALSSTSSPLAPGQPIRLSAGVTVRLQSGLRVDGELNGAWGYISLQESASALTLYYAPVEPSRPHLLECGCDTAKGAHVRLSANSSFDTSNQAKFVELSTFSLSKDDRRLMAVLVPSQPQIQLQLTVAKGESLAVNYCELTPFK